MDAILVLKILCIVGIVLCVVMMLWKQAQLAKTPEGKANIEWGKKPKNFISTSIVGFVANFFDTLGIGSFAPSSSAFKLTKSVDDLLVPGTLNVGDTVPVCVEAILFFDAFNIDPLTCVLMCAAATVGAFLGASIVSKWDRTKVRWGFGIGLIILSLIMFCRWKGVGPFALSNVEYQETQIGTVVEDRVINFVVDNKHNKEYAAGTLFEEEIKSGKYANLDEALKDNKLDIVDGKVGNIAAVGLVGSKLIVACIINFLLGAAMCLGVGLYAPCMALCFLIGLHTGMAFPIMMGSCAFLMAFGNGPKFIMEGRYDVVACWTQAIFGAIGVYIAAVFVKELPLHWLTLMVVIVCFITGCLYLKDAATGAK